MIKVLYPSRLELAQLWSLAVKKVDLDGVGVKEGEIR